MNREQYITELRQCLNDVNESDLEDAIRYCEEYFDEAGSENEQQAMDDLGKPSKFAAQIKADVAIRNTEQKTEEKRKSSFHNIWVIFLGIFAMPIAVPLMFAAVILMFAFFLVIFCLLIATILVGVAGVIAAVALFMSFVLTPFGATSLIRIGGAFFFLGIGCMICVGMYSALKMTVAWFNQVVSNLYKKAKGGRTHEI